MDFGLQLPSGLRIASRLPEEWKSWRASQASHWVSSSIGFSAAVIHMWLPEVNMKGPDQGRAHLPIQTPIQSSGSSPQIRFQTPSIPDQQMQYLKIHIALGVSSMPGPCPFPTKQKYLAHTHLVSLVGNSKSQSSFQTLPIKCAIQTLRIRQHRNVHAGHMVLTSSHVNSACSRNTSES